ncbi:hypothetical protein GQ600_21617 [Phytophthora cactorum]|nr:hypothetical protein GQ600_21617 [Phytophthora cactorum]
MSNLENFKSAQDAFNHISNELSDVPPRKSEAAIVNLEKWCQNLRQGDSYLMESLALSTQTSNAGPTSDDKIDKVMNRSLEMRMEKNDQSQNLKLVRSTRVVNA